MAKIVPAMQLVVHAKSSTMYGWSYSLKSKFFRLDKLLLFHTSFAHTSCSTVQLAAHAESSTLYVRKVVSPNFLAPQVY